MTTNTYEKRTRIWWGACALVAGLLASTSAGAFKDRIISIEASGDAAMFDVKATAAGTLKVCTKARRSSDRWRVSIFEPLKPGSAPPAIVNSAVGSGATSAFTGCASQTLVTGVQYIVAVSWDRPLQDRFLDSFLPSSAVATVRFSGATDADPPVVGIAPSCGPGTTGCQLANIIQRPNRWQEPTASCPADGSFIGCEALLACEFKSTDPTKPDTDAFKVKLPANSDLSVSINRGGSWKIYDPSGKLINPYGCGGQCEVALTTAGTYTILTYSLAQGPYTLSLLGISTPFRCGPRVSSGSTITGKFDLVGDTDSYLLEGVLATQVYSVALYGPGAAWKIFDPDGNAINPYGCAGQCDVTLPKAGGYTLKVWGSLAGSYTLTLQKVGGPGGATTALTTEANPNEAAPPDAVMTPPGDAMQAFPPREP